MKGKGSSQEASIRKQRQELETAVDSRDPVCVLIAPPWLSVLAREGDATPCRQPNDYKH